MSKTLNDITVKIGGEYYTYQGVTDLEIIPLANVLGTERPPEGTEAYKEWSKQFMYRFADYSSQRIVAHFLRCAFPDLPDSIVKYRVRRLQDGTEECDPGRDLRVKLSAKEFENILKIISPELGKIEEKLKLDEGGDDIYPEVFHASHAVQETPSIAQKLNAEEIALAVKKVLEGHQPSS